jgi:hypothetical protein
VVQPTTPAPTQGVLVSSDLTAFQNFFDAMNGKYWTKCSTVRDQPCACSFSDTYIRCGSPKGRRDLQKGTTTARLTGIHLPNNNLTGYLPEDVLNGLLGLGEFDVSGNAAILLQNSCAKLTFCASGGCVLPSGQALCPTSTPTTLNEPTSTTSTPTTLTPSTNAPIASRDEPFNGPTTSPPAAPVDVGLIAGPVIAVVILIVGIILIAVIYKRDGENSFVGRAIQRMSPTKERRANNNNNRGGGPAGAAGAAGGDGGGGGLTPFVAGEAPQVTDQEERMVARPASGRSHFTLLRDGAANESLKDNPSLTAAKEEALKIDVAAKKDAETVEELLNNLGLQELWPIFEEAAQTDPTFSSLPRLQNLVSRGTFDEEMTTKLHLKIGERVKLRRALDVRKGEAEAIFGTGA